MPVRILMCTIMFGVSFLSGMAFSETRFVTDIQHFQDGKPGLCLTRYYDEKSVQGIFGTGWKLLIPYRVLQKDTVKVRFLNVTIPVRLTVVDLISGKEYACTFNSDLESGAGWLPEPDNSCPFTLLHILSDATFRLTERDGKRCWFDESGVCTKMTLPQDRKIAIEYTGDTLSDLDVRPYVALGDQRDSVRWKKHMIPKTMKIANVMCNYNEVLNFSDTGRIIGWYPMRTDGTVFTFVALMSTWALRSVDRYGNEVLFDKEGRFRVFYSFGENLLPSAISMGDMKIRFSYTIDCRGIPRVRSAKMISDNNGTREIHKIVVYKYDPTGKLLRAVSRKR